ncbi:MAG: tryptophan 2,3-dioxygenase [Candidatus Dormibacteria bacterium]
MDGQYKASLTYSSYLALDQILGAQRPLTDEHDETLFIVIHQVYELWFKQLLHELAHLQAALEVGATSTVMHTFKRLLTVLKTVVGQVDVLETMTPRQFSSFRSRLVAASGFQSAQFRELEAVLGRREARVLDPYPEDSADRRAIAAAASRRSLFDSYLRYLSTQGYSVPADAINRDFNHPLVASTAIQDLVLLVYTDDRAAAQVSERMVDLDEGLQEWRYRHAKMVERTIGDKTGTGGSSGVEYLRAALFTPSFPDLWLVRGRL